MKSKIVLTLMVIAVMLGLQCCRHDEPKIEINTNTFNFNATNLTVDEGKLSANGGIPTTVNWTVNVTINGETKTLSGTSKSNELPVRAGDEIEIKFTPLCQEQTDAYFTMPDGTSFKATVNAPTFRWTVPDNFTPGMQIKGVCHYETENSIHNETGIITLIALE